MFIQKRFFSLLGLALLVVGVQLPAVAQATVSEAASANQLILSSDLPLEGQLVEQSIAEPIQSAAPAESPAATALIAENLTAENLTAESLGETRDAVVGQPLQPVTEADALAFPADGAAVEIAQVRRRTTGNFSSDNFIGVGADFGTGNNTSFAVISKFALSESLSIRPTVLVGNDFGALVPVTYEFNRFSTDVGGFQVRPYVGAGASYIDQSGGSDFGALITAGVDVPFSRQFTGNVQANYAGVFSNDSNFGVTVGVGYNFGGLF